VLTSSVAATLAKAARLNPNPAGIYRDKVARLRKELNRPELREEASAATPRKSAFYQSMASW
jgi:hypothetical protein